jgi:ferric-dicitrate binding protein FerR (iron transport regulator)
MQFRSNVTRYAAELTSREVLLSDGSVVALNRNSTLTWRADHDGKRLVTLKGDAYFDVAKDALKPFVITAETVEVEVLGTSFYVDARADQKTLDVSVATGQVAVRHAGAEVVLASGEKAIFNKTSNDLEKQENVDPNFNSVKTQKLFFQNSTLDEVINTLNRHYHARISAETPALETCLLTATFEDKSFDAVLQIVSTTLNLEVITQNQEIILRGTCTSN